MKVAIIGTGNMGGAIVRGLYLRKDVEIIISNRSSEKLEQLKTEMPNVKIAVTNADAAKDADIICLAVKPKQMWDVADEIRDLPGMSAKKIVSIAAGICINDLEKMFSQLAEECPGIYRAIPNTAISAANGITFIAYEDEQLDKRVTDIFLTMGRVEVIDEKLIGAATALCSCGIAYAFKYVQAMTQAGVQLGFRPEEALSYSIATVEGAMSLLEQNRTTPQQEIDKVTTPGGMTIRGVNTLEHTGFVSAVIDAVIEPLK